MEFTIFPITNEDREVIGVRLTAFLKEFGLVSHSLWILVEDQ